MGKENIHSSNIEDNKNLFRGEILPKGGQFDHRIPNILLENKVNILEPRLLLLQAEVERLRLQNTGLSERIVRANATIRAANRRIKSLEQDNAGLRAGRQFSMRDQDYASLGLDPDTAFLGLTEEQIQTVLLSAFRARAKIHHPDRSKEDGEEMKRVNHAYDRLKDPKTRRSFSR